MNESPYRSMILAPSLEQQYTYKYVFVNSMPGIECPICNGSRDYGLNAWFGQNKICTPFKRLTLKRFWFRKNLKCSLNGIHKHWHCYLCDSNYILMLNDKFETKEIVYTSS